MGKWLYLKNSYSEINDQIQPFANGWRERSVASNQQEHRVEKRSHKTPLYLYKHLIILVLSFWL